MSEPLKFQNPLTRIVAIKGRPLAHGLADPQIPNQQHIDTEGNPSLNKFYPKGGSDWINEPILGPNAEQFKTILPGMFTGEMRKVVQDNISRGLTVPYAYGFAGTNGIFVAGNGDRWVVEITSGSIEAWPLRKRDIPAGDNRLDSLDYAPGLSPKPLPGEGNYDDLIHLNVPDLVDPYTGRSALFSECGWAFSADGHLASVVTFEDRTDTPNPATVGLSYGYSRLYTITIIESGNQPASASIIEVESDWLYGDRVTHFKYPDYANDTLFSYDWFRGHPSPPYAPGTGLEAPIHCWYNGGTLKVVRFHNSGGSTSQPYIANPIVPAPNATTNPGPVDTTPWGDVTVTSGVYNCFSSPIYSVFEGTVESGDKTYWTEYDHYDWLCKDEEYGPFYLESGLWAKQAEAGVNSSSTVGQDNVIIAMNDRESVAHYRAFSTTNTATGVTRTDGVLWYDGTDDIYPKGQGGEAVATSTTQPSNTNWSATCKGIAPLAILQDGHYNDPRDPTDSFSWTSAWTGKAMVVDPYYISANVPPYPICPTFQSSIEANGAAFAVAHSSNTGDPYAYNGWRYRSGYPNSSNEAWYDINLKRTDITWDGWFTNVTIRVGPNADYSPSFVYASSANQSSTPVSDPPVNSEAAAWYVDSSLISVTIDVVESEPEWGYYIDDVENQFQWLLAAVDMSGNEPPIYLEQPVSSRSSWGYSDQITSATVNYPVDEITKTSPSYTGNP